MFWRFWRKPKVLARLQELGSQGLSLSLEPYQISAVDVTLNNHGTRGGRVVDVNALPGMLMHAGAGENDPRHAKLYIEMLQLHLELIEHSHDMRLARRLIWSMKVAIDWLERRNALLYRGGWMLCSSLDRSTLCATIHIGKKGWKVNFTDMDGFSEQLSKISEGLTKIERGLLSAMLWIESDRADEDFPFLPEIFSEFLGDIARELDDED